MVKERIESKEAGRPVGVPLGVEFMGKRRKVKLRLRLPGGRRKARRGGKRR